MAEFDNPTALVKAARAAREKGYRKLDAFSPFPIEGLTDALHLHKNKLPLIVLTGGIIGGLTGYLLQYYITVINFPINIGGRPLDSWPSYIIITFELTILFAALSAVLGLLGVVRPAHALPSGLQRAEVRAGFPQPVLPVHRIRRPAVRRGRDGRFFADPGASRGDRSCALIGNSGRLCWRSPRPRPAVRTCTTSPSTSRCGRAISSTTAAPNGLCSKARSRVAICEDDVAFYTGKGPDGKPVDDVPFPRHAGGPGTRPAALQHLLHSVSRPSGRR